LAMSFILFFEVHSKHRDSESAVISRSRTEGVQKIANLAV
jgi:hypothetical protein